MKRLKHVIVAAALAAAGQAAALDWRDSPEVGALFRAQGVEGTFVLYDAAAERYVGHDRERAERRLVPASTFKIPHTLIGLSVGAVRDVDEVLPYGGRPQWIKQWEQDMSLREAIRVSNVPIYQELARRIGLERMRAQLAALDYGNGETGGVVDRFWLEGPLRISALEQVRFLCRLARGQLPFPERAQTAVREIVRLEQGDGWTLYGKTGWAMDVQPQTGWWVGWVEKGARPYCFALNMDMKNAEDAARRMELGRASLRALGAL